MPAAIETSMSIQVETGIAVTVTGMTDHDEKISLGEQRLSPESDASGGVFDRHAKGFRHGNFQSHGTAFTEARFDMKATVDPAYGSQY